MTAVLCRHFGLEHIEIAEDIASDTFLKASEHWAVHGVPENPTGWLYTVARNKVKHLLRHLKIVRDHAGDGQRIFCDTSDFEFEVSEHIISDSQLAMIFAVCNPVF